MSQQFNMVCLRCQGLGSVEVDNIPGTSPSLCHRCGGNGKEPLWARSTEAWEIQYRRLATADGADLLLQDAIVDVIVGMVERLHRKNYISERY